MFHNLFKIIDRILGYFAVNSKMALYAILFAGFLYFMINSKTAYHEPRKFFKKFSLLISILFVLFFVFISKDILAAVMFCIIFIYTVFYFPTGGKKRYKENKTSKAKNDDVVLILGGISWKLREFCRGWIVTGDTGSGKTSGFYINLLHQLFKNTPKWGGLTVDAKGSFYKDVEGVAKNYSKGNKIIVIGPGRNSTHKFNLLSYSKIPWSRYADIIVNVAAPGTAEGGSGSGGHFKVRIKNVLIHTMELLDLIYKHDGRGEKITIVKVRNFINISVVQEIIKNLPDDIKDTEAAKYFKNDFLYHADKGGDEFQSFLTTLSNYLSPYLNKDIAEIFCSEEATFDFSDIDDGKIICVSIPSIYSERDHVNTFMKELFYYHTQLREELKKEELKEKNLLLFIADEAQSIVTKSEGMDDSKVIDKIRSSKSTVVFASQSTTSYLDKLGQFKTETLLLNLANKVYFRQPDERGAKMAESDLGKSEEFEKQSYGYSNRKANVTYSKKEKGEHRYYDLRKLPDFVCVVKHSSKYTTREIKLNPLDYNGKVLKFD
ncbi:MAG TPA: type IV secretion system DNA-binding domain-containing protein [Victivallales bacterium]|nr:type IV secretion system DNA-binding domain-containing protein [Victivallales bacterium]